LSGNANPDAWIAATVKTLGSRLVTFDRGYSRLLSRSELTILEPR
jgi:predicted nucleic acid-binding protein